MKKFSFKTRVLDRINPNYGQNVLFCKQGKIYLVWNAGFEHFGFENFLNPPQENLLEAQTQKI